MRGPRQGGRLTREERQTLLRLMSDDFAQHTKLGGCFPPRTQLATGRFWRLAAAYLQLPVTPVMLAGMRLRAGAAGWAGVVARACLLAFPFE